MTSKLRPAVEVWWKADTAFGAACLGDGRGDKAAAAVIEADREAVRAEQAAELAKWKALAETLRLEVEKQEALHVSAYHAGLKAGWNFCVDDNHEGMQAAMASTDYIKELRRIRKALTSYKEQRDV